jgi:hypothetical protein
VIAAAMLLALGEPPLSLDPFMDETVAASAMEANLECVARGAFDRKADGREAKVIALEIINLCSGRASALRSALVDVYRRKPVLVPPGKTPEVAAEIYAKKFNDSAEAVVLESRKHR